MLTCPHGFTGPQLPNDSSRVVKVPADNSVPAKPGTSTLSEPQSRPSPHIGNDVASTRPVPRHTASSRSPLSASRRARKRRWLTEKETVTLRIFACRSCWAENESGVRFIQDDAVDYFTNRAERWRLAQPSGRLAGRRRRDSHQGRGSVRLRKTEKARTTWWASFDERALEFTSIKKNLSSVAPRNARSADVVS